MMPAQQLRDVENRLFGLKTCFNLTKQDLAADPVCPHCGFRPVEEAAGGVRAADLLAQVDEDLDRLVQDWTQALLANLEDPTVAANLELLGESEGRRALEEFLKSRELPEPIGPTFVKALQDVLSGLEKVVVTQRKLHGALIRGGVPCTVAELRERFDRYVADITKGKDPGKVRVVLE